MSYPLKIQTLSKNIPYENLKAGNPMITCFTTFIKNYQYMWANKDIAIAEKYYNDMVLIYIDGFYQPVEKADFIDRISAFFQTYATLSYNPVDIQYCGDNVLTIFGVFNYGPNTANFIQMFYFNKDCKIYKLNDVTAYPSDPLPPN